MGDGVQSERHETEVLAVLIADLRTSGASTAQSLQEAAVASLESLTRRRQNVVVQGDRLTRKRFHIAIEGPSLFGHVTITLIDPFKRTRR